MKKILIIITLCLILFQAVYADEIYSKDCNIENKSIKYYKNIIEKNPQDICAYYNLSIKYANKNKINDELFYLIVITSINPKDINAYEMRALIYDIHNDKESYYKEYAHLVKEVPNYAKGHKILAEAYENIIDYENTLKHINIAIELTKEPDEDLLYKKASIYENMGKFEEAIVEYKKVSKINPINHFSHYQTGNCLMRLGKYNEAIEEYSKSIKINPNDSFAYNKRSKCYEKIGKIQEAKNDEAESKKYMSEIGFMDKISSKLFELRERAAYKRLITIY